MRAIAMGEGLPDRKGSNEYPSLHPQPSVSCWSLPLAEHKLKPWDKGAQVTQSITSDSWDTEQGRGWTGESHGEGGGKKRE